MIWITDTHTKTLWPCHKTTHFFRISSSGVLFPHGTGIPNLNSRAVSTACRNTSKTPTGDDGRWLQGAVKGQAEVFHTQKKKKKMVKDQPSFSFLMSETTHALHWLVLTFHSACIMLEQRIWAAVDKVGLTLPLKVPSAPSPGARGFQPRSKYLFRDESWQKLGEGGCLQVFSSM